MDNCIFCKIINKEIPNNDIIYEDENVLVMLDMDWVVKGHTLVIWKNHQINLSDLSIEEYQYFSSIVYQTEKILLSYLHVDKSVILKTGGLVAHFHFHIYPMNSNTPWQNIKEMFDKKTKYGYTPEEAAEFVSDMKKLLGNEMVLSK